MILRVLMAASVTLFLAALALFALSVMTGESTIGIFVIFPFIVAEGPIAVIATLSLIFAVILMFLGFFTAVPRIGEQVVDRPGISSGEPAVEKKTGGVILIGPIPIVFGSDSKIARSMIILAVILVTVVIALFVLLTFFNS